MLSRVADSLYWMSRYFERADQCARVLDSHYSLLLNPSLAGTEKRWPLVTLSLGLPAVDAISDPHSDIARLLSDEKEPGSIVSCIESARDNASQTREQISSEMWECLNGLFHDVGRARMQPGNDDAHPLRLVNRVREGCYRFYGVTDATVSHGEGWQFIRLGRYMERACAIARLLDAYFSTTAEVDDLEWVALLSSCLAFESYCKVYTADLTPQRVAEFLLLDAEFPYTIRHAADRMRESLGAIAEASPTRKSARIDRMIGHLRSSLAYAQIEEIMERGLHSYLCGVIDHCQDLHHAIHELYIDYPIASALEV
jgi:uncharacterized alpha-E superfamily protein